MGESKGGFFQEARFYAAYEVTGLMQAFSSFALEFAAI